MCKPAILGLSPKAPIYALKCRPANPGLWENRFES